MLFILHDSVFRAGRALELIAFLGMAAQSHRHVVVARDPGSDAFKEWLAALDDRLASEVTALMDAGYRRTAQATTISVVTVGSDAADGESILRGLQAAARQATQPFPVYVENSRNDRRFLLATCTEAQRTRLSALEECGELVFRHGGGNGELRKQLEADCERSRIAPEYAFVIFDSDSLLPDAPTSEAVRLKTKCEELRVPHALLKRRAIENYLTRNHLRGWVYSGKKHSEARRQRQAVFAAFLELSRTLANHYNMKGGISYDRRRPDYPASDNIYTSAGVSLAAIGALEHGFGDDLASSFDWPLSEAELKAEGSWEELQEIVQRIERLL